MSTRASPSRQELIQQVAELSGRLQETEQALEAIRGGEVDAIVVSGKRGEQIFSLTGVDSVYRLIVESMQEAALTSTPDGRILFCNRQFGAMLRISIETLIGQKLADLVAPEDHPMLAAILTASESKPVKGRVRFIGRSGAVPSYVSASFLPQPGGPSVCIVAADLSALEASAAHVEGLNRQKRLLEESSEQLEVLSEAAGRLLQAEKPQGIIGSLSRGMMKVLDCQVFLNYLVEPGGAGLRLNAFAGISRDWVAQMRRLEMGQGLCGRAALEQQQIITANVQEGKDSASEQVQPLGVTAYAVMPLLGGGQVIGTLSFGTRTREKFSAQDIMLMRTFADYMAAAMVRRKGAEDLARANADLELKVSERTDDLARTVRELRKEAETRAAVEEVLRASNVELKSSARQLRSLAGELTRAEERERRRLASLLHDDLQQVLVGVRLRMDRLLSEAGDALAPSVKSVIELVEESVRKSRSLAAEISPPIRLGAGLVAAFEWLARSMSEKYSFTVRLTSRGNVDPVGEEISILLFRSTRELLFNAVKHAAVKSADLAVDADEDTLRITVSDGGSGFDVDRVAKASGVDSFGLFSIRERLSLVGGTMEMKSQPGSGSSFTLAIPLENVRPAPGTHAGPSAAPEGIPGTRSAGAGAGQPEIRLMIVDDHKVTREGLVQLLSREAGIHIVCECEEGEAAVRRAGELDPGVILMDVSMPGMDGIEATRTILRKHPRIRVIGLSMFEEDAVAAAMKDAGAVAYIAKSSAPRLLVETIRAVGAHADVAGPA